MFMRKTIKKLDEIYRRQVQTTDMICSLDYRNLVKLTERSPEEQKKEYVAEDLVGHDVLIHVSGMIGSSPIELVHVTASSDCGKYITYSVDQKTCWVHISNVVSVFGIDEAPVNPLIPTRESKEKADCEDDVDLESPYRFLETR